MINVTSEAKHFLQDFEALPDPAKREVLAELIRFSLYLDYPRIADDELVSAANEIFSGYDRREAGE